MRFLFYLFSVFLLSSACRDTDIKDLSPSERNKKSIENLRNELIQAPYGWKVIYFPKTDSLLFSNKDEIIEKDPAYKQKYGYGGHYYTMKFEENGKVKMLADTDYTTLNEEMESEFEVKQNTFTQLSFTTPSYLNKLINEKFSGSPDFLYVGKDWEGNLVFKTASYISPAKEYIIFEKLKNKDSFQKFVKLSYDNRVYFDEIENPQITIRKGSKIFFQSDVISETRFVAPFIKQMEYQRYYLFRFNKKPNPDPNVIDPRESTGLGSGYVGTEQGLTFRAGIRYSKDYIFHDFKRVDGKFICELVKVYDPIMKVYRVVSKHLAPNDAESTGYIAEIE